MRRLALLILVCGGCATTSNSRPEPHFFAGVGVADMTPDHPVPLGGYGARKGALMTGVHDHIFAKALWLETRTTRVCLITTDFIGSTDEMRQAVQARLSLDYRCHLILAASHNHSGPGGLTKNPLLSFAMGAFDQKLWDTYVDHLTDLVRRAAEGRTEADVAFARGEAPELQRNRRAKHYEGVAPTDPEILVMRVFQMALKRADAEHMALFLHADYLVNYTAHGTVLGDKNFEVSGDWAGAFQRSLEKRGSRTAFYTNGAEGDISPATPGEGDPFQLCENMGAALADHVEKILKDVDKPTSDVKLNYVEERVTLPTPTNPLVPTKSVFGILAINDAAFLCVPGELCCELGLALKKKFRERGFKYVAIVGLANDHLGYFLTEEQYHKGGYEKNVSFYGPGMGDFVVRTFERLGERVHAENRAGQPERRGR